MNEKELNLLAMASNDLVGCYIKYFRKRLNLSRLKLSKILGVTTTIIGSYETETAVPDRKFISTFYNGINKYVEDNDIIIKR